MYNKIIAFSNTVDIILHTFSIRNDVRRTLRDSEIVHIGRSAQRLMFIKCYRFNSTLDSAAEAFIEFRVLLYYFLLWAQYDRWVIGG